MKILYIPCHVTLEYDEITVLTELGHQVFSTGLYGDSTKVEENFKQYALKLKRFAHERPFSIPNYSTDQTLLEQYNSFPNNTFCYERRPFTLPREFLDSFDAIYAHHNAVLCSQLRQSAPNVPVIFNTVSQADQGMENSLKALKASDIKIIRFFATERITDDCVEADAIIPQFVDETEYKDWHGSIPESLTVCRGIPARPIHTNANLFWLMSQNVPMKLLGPGNEGIPNSLGAVSYKELKEAYRAYRMFFSVGTKPGGMTYTCIEALMTGCPIVSVGKELGGSKDVGGGYTNAVPSIITNGVNGFFSDSVNELIYYCSALLKDPTLANNMSRESRKLALQLFSKSAIKEKWSQLLEKL